MVESKHAEIVVIGAGPGGYAAAFRAADLGKKVILIDKDPTLGGVCLNRGCIPSKVLLHISKVMDEASHLSKMGVTYSEPEINLDAIRAHKDKIVSQLNSGIEKMATARKVEWVRGKALFNSNSELNVINDDGEIKISFDKCIVAAGSVSATIPGVPADHPSVLTSRTALELVDIPERLLVIGGGVIGLELGQVYAALGAKVSVVEFLPNLIPGADQDIVKPLQRKLKKQFESIRLSSKVTSVLPNEDESLTVTIENEKGTSTEIYNKVLVSVGRKPNTNLLNIESTGVEVDERGFINVDVYQRTTIKNIFAIGDIVGNPMLAHKATHEGKVAAEVASGLPAAFDVRAIPSVVFTDPEVAWAGLTEIEAKEKGINYKKGEFPWAASGKAIAMGANQGKTKILFDPETSQVLGVGIVGPGAGDMISEGMLAIEMGADAEDIGLTIHPHPTLGETFGLAAEVFEGTITDLYVPKK
ncbi:MAG: dihydrolipoyl dehydrogenase [Candidatus Marinimicrobia bacterium]|jgi:dihydrolipoamide dehydrogenase|nr:dihydrolipoyl dehydrogenase [Candidatus Neomarinimicrobiota bacterium]MBT3675767.1 dihydrolipoyl dehydrogenase [Candidatus Neomarinimicrobiota bacterium]MBT4067951.1 dihydrolipoyl dehydrogenase [Candidatus Neomarinimicrobiota bacterium]MBT4308282.1 dihydrolipoyl dehydrogenase [Candidatus Neomarinimicrobiota bacterium]MBT5176126.1 dihydrolipoyl dehydrogenase [Candidatus Neomarinimicrobiota bacterium]